MKNGFLDIIKAFRTPRIKGPEETEVLDSVFGEDNGYNRFYSRAGIVYRLTGFVFLFAFLVYLILTTVANLDKITYENAEYIVRNFAERLEDNERESSGMIYDPDGEMRFSLFGKGPAICGNTGVTVFSATGRRTCRDVAEMPDPAVKASAKYAVAFGSGGCEYYVYNAFSRVYSGRTERPVYAFSVADNGSYLYITSGEIYESEIVLCDSDFGVRAVYGKNDPAVCAVIDPDGSRFAVITLGLSGTGKYSATLSVYPFASETESFTVALEDVLPLDCVFSKEGITVLCDNCVQRFDGAGRLVCRDFFSGEIVCASLSYGSSAVVTRKTSGVETVYSVLLSASGRVGLATDLPEAVFSAAAAGGGVYLLGRGGIRFFDGLLSEPRDSGRAVSEGDVILAYSDKGLYHVTRSAAYPFSYSD